MPGGLDDRGHELHVLVDELNNAQNDVAGQLTTRLNTTTYTQQQLTTQDPISGIDMVEASKSFAEEIKKDGSSTKTLAVVTMCILPATSVSSVARTGDATLRLEGGKRKCGGSLALGCPCSCCSTYFDDCWHLAGVAAQCLQQTNSW